MKTPASSRRTGTDLRSTTATMPVLMNQDQVADYLGVSAKWLERDRWAGPTIPFVKVGRHVRYRASDVLAYIEKAVSA